MPDKEHDDHDPLEIIRSMPYLRMLGPGETHKLLGPLFELSYCNIDSIKNAEVEYMSEHKFNVNDFIDAMDQLYLIHRYLFAVPAYVSEPLPHFMGFKMGRSPLSPSGQENEIWPLIEQPDGSFAISQTGCGVIGGGGAYLGEFDYFRRVFGLRFPERQPSD